VNYARKEFCSEWNADISLQLHLQLQLLPVEPRKRHADGSCGQPFNPHEKLYRKFKKEAISELGLAPVYAAKCVCAGSRAASKLVEPGPQADCGRPSPRMLSGIV